MFEGPSVYAVVGGVEAALWEPDDVALVEGAGADGLEGAVPVEGLTGHLHTVINIGADWIAGNHVPGTGDR